MDRSGMSRRSFLSAAVAATAGTHFLSAPFEDYASQASPELDAFIRERMVRYDIAGVAACVTRRDGILWSGAYGFADLEQQTPMSLDSVQNIASISKTFTTTALMQLWEQGYFHLDDDVSDYLPFPVRNPAYPDVPITFRLLLTHQSSIRDGDWYHRMYQCGDPAVSLADWIEGYLEPGGQFYDAEENFQEWGPRDRWDYNNVAYGLLGYLVQRISGRDFAEYCRAGIFEPLGLDQTAWYLSEIDLSNHVVPYTVVKEGEVRSPTWGGRPLGVIREDVGSTVPGEDGHHANCAYNHPNFPDGFMRTSVRQLSAYARAYLNGGTLNGRRILQQASIETMLSSQVRGDFGDQGLTWYGATSVRGQEVWQHGGSDPGVNTNFQLVPSEGIAAIVFTNTWGTSPSQIVERMLVEAPNL
jgi:CubicO group peptidase (beta-lactamase class C family)